MAVQQKWRVAAAIIGILLFVLLLLVPRTPSVDGERAETITSESAVDDEVQEALELVRGEQPMQGILKLRDIADKDPHNLEASWQLGLLSMETGQFDKAIKRFESVIEHDHNTQYLEAFIYLGHSFEQMGNVEQAKKNYKRFLESESDPMLMNDVQERLRGLE